MKPCCAPGSLRQFKLDLVFDPPWTKNRMSEAARLELGTEDTIPIARISRR